jgi:hypothetical protein
MEKLKHKVRSDVFESLIDGKNIFVKYRSDISITYGCIYSEYKVVIINSFM